MLTNLRPIIQHKINLHKNKPKFADSSRNSLEIKNEAQALIELMEFVFYSREISF